MFIAEKNLSNNEEYIEIKKTGKSNKKEFIYIPVCNNCDEILEIKFNLNNFTIEYECSKNPNHKQSNIFFETFDNYYLKKKIFAQCSKCALYLDNDLEYVCKECKYIYCTDCFISDLHIKNNLDNLTIKSNKCKRHKEAMKNYYCTDCHENKCNFCINEVCKDHKVENIIYDIPSVNQVNSMNNIISEKVEYINNVLISIDKWEKKLKQKIEQLKNKLKKEIVIFEKMFLNHNRQYLNHTYHLNFKKFLKLTKNVNNEYLKKFYESVSFEDKTKIIFELLCMDKKKLRQKKGYLESLDNEYLENYTKIDERYFCAYSKQNNIFSILWYENDDDNQNGFYSNNSLEINFNEEIYSISFSLNKRKIYICLSNKKIVKILDFDIDNENLKICEEEIKNEYEQNKHFIKCIELANNLVAVSDEESILIWKNNDKKYLKIKTIELNEYPLDLLFINNDYFIFSLYESEKIVFYDIKNFKIIEDISNIDSINSNNCLLLYKKKYIIVNCEKGIAVIYTNTRQLIQYIENYEGYENKNICIDNNDNIAIYNISKNVGIMKFIFDDGYFIPVEEYKVIIKEEKEDDRDNSDLEKGSDLFFLNEDNSIIVLMGVKAYVIKENE